MLINQAIRLSLSGVFMTEETEIKISVLKANERTEIYFVFGAYINLRNIASKSAIVAGLGFPGAHASAAADSQRKARSAS